MNNRTMTNEISAQTGIVFRNSVKSNIGKLKHGFLRVGSKKMAG